MHQLSEIAVTYHAPAVERRVHTSAIASVAGTSPIQIR